ncbi:30S ribosome-binding factor RbfA [Nitratifractor salsuginis]|uniref:Ribosome-binding factor A n=1 Tax=Nitratifractor salsuginis (strain DSM 16511 / JCM 12458 / E9I37-1) TaxID=749222 RepID=E6X271_NITSE|nr:30S ribosome-binding factor RbfA [Nitratifractor salsuginis]ADV47140.1 ribosome-binding factor A [Nitratifractor salsuginis DSM 16511]
MTQAEIKRKRTESVLKELIPEALSTLDDERINALNVTEVLCSRGRYDARVFLDPTGIEPEEQEEALKRLRKVAGYLKTYVKEAEGWYKAPNFTFEFDDQLERISKMDQLFKKIEKELGNES